jgi:D-3-phosphoglycerate dehydrogenase
VARKIPAAHRDVCSGDWNRDRFRGLELNGRALGVIGFGRLGKKVANYARAFRMNVLACDKNAKIPSWATKCGLDDLCGRADIVSLHASADLENFNMMGAQQFSAMRRGAIFINTARGELVDEAALLESLRSGRLGGAALDVLKAENSQDPADIACAMELRTYAGTHDNLVLTPHLGGSTFESIQKTESFVTKSLISAALCRAASEG